MSPRPAWWDQEIGMALWWLTNERAGAVSGPDIVERLLARGHVHDRAEARAILSLARQDVTATERLQRASTGQSLRSACDYKCPPDTPIALRVRVNAVRPDGTLVESRSVVINARASENLQDVLQRAQAVFDSLYARGTRSRSGEMRMERTPTPADVDQVLLGYTQGR